MRHLLVTLILGSLAAPALHSEWCEAVPADAPVQRELRLLRPELVNEVPVVDLLALYISQAGSAADIRALLEPQVAYLNAALAASQVPGSVRLVGVLEAPASIPYESTASQFLLTRIANDTGVRRLRNQHGADLVTLVVPREMLDGAGLAFINNVPETAFSILSAPLLVTISQLLAHEVGHTLGLPHDRAHADGYGGPYGERAYGHFGVFSDGTRFSDIMTVGNPCPDGCQTIAPFFSNPEVTHRGAVMGIPGEREAALVLRSDALARASAHRVSRQGTCVPGASVLCLGSSRFHVTAAWRTREGTQGTGMARSLTADTGYFWFFSEANVEVIAKVVNGCGLNERYWFFASGLTDVNVTLTVLDTVSGSTRTYTNPQGRAFLPVQDTAAFATCP